MRLMNEITYEPKKAGCVICHMIAQFCVDMYFRGILMYFFIYKVFESFHRNRVAKHIIYIPLNKWKYILR